MASADDILGIKKSASDLLGVQEPSAKTTQQSMRDAYSSPTGAIDPYSGTFIPGVSQEEINRNYAQTGAGVTKGAVAGTLGLPGDILNIPSTVETLGRAGLRAAGVNVKPQSVIPEVPIGSEDVYKFLFGKPKSESEQFGAGLGQILGGFVGPAAAEKALGKIGETVVGRAGMQAAKVAQRAEDEGLSVSASQVRGEAPKNKPLSPSEQTKINEAVSAETGEKTNLVTPEFIRKRIEDLGKDYDKLYSGGFQIDETIAQAAKNIAAQEASIGAAGDGGISSIARNIVGRYEKAKADAMEQAMLKIMSGQQTALKRGKGNVVTRTFGPGERIDAVPLTQDLLRYYGAGDHANVRHITAADAPEWGKEVNSLLTELTDKLGLRVRPGVYVGDGSGSYGWAHPYGHIFLNEKLLKTPKDAVATALHEFGHQVEFQLFEQAPKDVKRAINEAWNASKAEGVGKTVEQLRPITSEKYGPEHAGLIPSTAREKEYYLGFNEWFAEQVSRWLTTAKEPVTIADKFFKGIADAWRAIYNKVKGYLPMSQSADEFMRLNWEGKLINESVTKNIFELPEGSTFIPTSSTQAPTLTEPVIATIDGESLRRLRSYISSKAANASDGNERYQARELLNQIDAAIEKTNPKIAKKLQETNKKYRATMALQNLNQAKDPSIVRGNVDPFVLGNMLRAEGTDLSHPLSKYGQYGTTLGMTSRTIPDRGTGELAKLLSASGRKIEALSYPLSYPIGRARRAIQRSMAPEGAVPETQITTVGKAATTVAAEANRAIQQRLEAERKRKAKR